MINSINEEKEFQKANNLFEKMESKKKRSDNGTVVEYTKKNDDSTFGIVKEGSLYTIKVSGKKNPVLVAEDFDYVEGYEARKRFQRSTLQEAIKYLHLYLNEEKYVVDVPVVTQQAPAPEIPAIDNPQDMPTDSNDEMGDENEGDMDGEAEDDDQKEIQKMTGKLAQDLRQEIQDGKEEFTVGMFKSIIAAAKELPTDLKSEVMNKAQEVLSSEEGGEESAAGGEEEMNEAFWNRGSKDKNYEKIGFELPVWAANALVNNDTSDLNTLQKVNLKQFKTMIGDKYGNVKFNAGEVDKKNTGNEEDALEDYFSKKKTVYISVPSNYEINEGEGKFKEVSFEVPEWSLGALINGDYSGLDDEEEQKLNRFVQGVVKKYGNAHFYGGSKEDALDFKYTNAIDNLGSNVFEVFILVPKEENNPEEMNESYNQTRKIAKMLSEEKKQKQYTDEEVEKMVSQLALKLKTAEKAYAQVLPEDTEIKDMLNKLYHKLFNIKTIKSRKEEISKKRKTAVQQKESAVQSTVNHIMSKRPKDITEEGSAVMTTSDYNKEGGKVKGPVRVIPDTKASMMQTTGKLQETKKMTVGGLKNLMESFDWDKTKHNYETYKFDEVAEEVLKNLEITDSEWDNVEELTAVGKYRIFSNLPSLDRDQLIFTYKKLPFNKGEEEKPKCVINLRVPGKFAEAFECFDYEYSIKEAMIHLLRELDEVINSNDDDY